MRRALLLALLLLPAVPAQGPPPLEVALADFAFEYGPETWKGDASTIEDQASLATQSADWSASLGLRLEANLTVAPRDGAAGADWEYEARLSDGVTTVHGVVIAQGQGALTVWFDVDGQRSLPGLAAVPALLPGPWTLRVEAFEPEGTGHESRGWGQTTLETQGVAFGGLRAGPGAPHVPGIAIPEGLLPRIREAGPGPNTWVNAQPLRPGTVLVEASAQPGAALRVVTYQAVDVGPPLPDPGIGTPLEGAVERSPTLQWQRQDQGTFTAGADGSLRLAVGTNGTGLSVFAVHGARGGVAAFAVAFSETTPLVDAWIAPEPGESGDVEVGLAAGGLRTRQGSPGYAYALQQSVPMTTGSSLGGKALSQGPVFLDGDEHWRAVFDARPIRAAGVSNYTFLAFLFDESGAYRTHLGIVRGGDVSLDVPRLGVGHAADLVVRVGNGADDRQPGPATALALPGQLTLSFAGQEVASASVQVPEGGTLKRTFATTPEEDGAKEVRALLDTGDLRHEVRRTETVLRADDFEEGSWYERLTPGPSLLWALAALLLARRGRPAPLPSQR